jgi:hypothetical protein
LRQAQEGGEGEARAGEAGVNSYLSVIGGAVATYVIVANFGWLGLLISLPFFAALPFIWHWAKARRSRRNSLR